MNNIANPCASTKLSSQGSGLRRAMQGVADSIRQYAPSRRVDPILLDPFPIRGVDFWPLEPELYASVTRLDITDAL
jgi:hypothetical protein